LVPFFGTIFDAGTGTGTPGTETVGGKKSKTQLREIDVLKTISGFRFLSRFRLFFCDGIEFFK